MEENEKEEQETNKVKSKKSNKKIFIVIGALVVVLIVGIVVKIITNKQEQKRREEENLINYWPVERYDSIEDMYYPVVKKPIIYLYPQEETELTVKLGYPEKLTCSYPKYENEWNVIAQPDGTIIDKKSGKKLYSLYWEGKGKEEYDFDEGFCVKGEDTAKFLEEKLEILGLNYKEKEEFIIYWLPKMEDNKYNFIRFASSEEINEYMPLEFSKEPDSLIRVMMQFKGLDEYMEVKEQKLETPERAEFVAVEWGGSELK